MDSRKRFRPEISNNYVKQMFSKKRFDKKKRSIDSGPNTKSITSIPSDMLPKMKKLTAPIQQPEYAKPDHWLKTNQEVKLSREEVFKMEKANISNMLSSQQGWSRAARSLTSAIKPVAQSTSSINPEDLEDSKLSGSVSFGPIRTERKNNSREFLQTFFKRASSIAAEHENRKKKTTSKLIKRIPKLATGIKPGVDEIIL